MQFVESMVRYADALNQTIRYSTLYHYKPIFNPYRHVKWREAQQNTDKSS